MAIERTMGIETEYGIMGGSAHQVLSGYQGRKKTQYNSGKTNESAVEGLHDIGGHNGGDYQTIDEQLGIPGMPPQRVTVGGYVGKKAKKIAKSVANAFDLSYQNTGDIIANGSRFYIDMGHPEYSTAEASNPLELTLVDKVGERIVEQSAMNAGSKIKIYKNNTDGKGNSYGCHENYLIKRMTGDKFENEFTNALIPFFITRQIFTGAGKINVETESVGYGGYGNYYMGPNYGYAQRNVAATHGIEDDTTASYNRQVVKTLEAIESLGKHFLDMSEDYVAVEKVLKDLLTKRTSAGPQQVYQLSQRADFFTKIIGLGTTSDRPIMNTRDEPHADRSKYMRLHVINGDANMSEVATYLKTGTTSLILDMFEDGIIPKFDLLNPVKQFQNISLDQSRKWNVKLADDKTMPAIDIQRTFMETARKAYAGKNSVTDDILSRWNYTLDALEQDPMKLFGKVDWVTKLGLVTKISASKGLKFTDPTILNAALQYHDIDRSQGLFYLLQNKGMTERLLDDATIESMLYEPPASTRAYLRGKATELPSVKKVDWGEFEIKAGKKTYTVNLNEPLSGNKEQVEKILATNDPKKIVDGLKKVEGITCEEKKFYAPKHVQGYAPEQFSSPGRFSGTSDDFWENYTRSAGISRNPRFNPDNEFEF
jgi:hypothetical protein